MASDADARRAAHPAALGWPVRPPAGCVPDAWDLVTDGEHAIWWNWLAIAPGTSPRELPACWQLVDDLGMGLGLYVPRRLVARDLMIDPEALQVVRLIDLDGWSRRKTGRRLYPETEAPRATAGMRRDHGRAQLAAAGVLPWAAWPGGRLPRAWWDEGATHAAFGAWRSAATVARAHGSSLPRLARKVVAAAKAAPHATVEGAWAAVARRLAA